MLAKHVGQAEPEQDADAHTDAHHLQEKSVRISRKTSELWEAI